MLTGVRTACDMKKAAALLLIIGLLSTACAGGGSAEAQVDRAVRDYFQAISTRDPALFCSRIEPSFGFFVDDENCRESVRFMADKGGWYPVHFEGDGPFIPEPQLVNVSDVSVNGGTASVVASVTWVGERADERRSFGDGGLSMRLVRDEGSWRIASVENTLVSPAREPDALAVTRAVFDYYQAASMAAGADRGTGFWATVPSAPGEVRERYILSAVIDVRYSQGYAAATVEAHDVANGTVGHPLRYDLVLCCGGSAWHVVPPTDPAYALFGD